MAGTLTLTGCGSPLPPIPSTAATATTSPDAREIFDACLAAHGGAAAYARLHDVNVRFSSHWASIGPKLQPKLSDTGYREGSEEWYHAMPGGWTVEQTHRGPKGVKHVLRIPPDKVVVNYCGSSAPSTDPEVNAAAALVTDAYSMFLFGPEVQVDLSNQQEFAGVMFPTDYYERIDRPVNLDAHRWQLLDLQANRGHAVSAAAPPAKGR